MGYEVGTVRCSVHDDECEVQWVIHVLRAAAESARMMQGTSGAVNQHLNAQFAQLSGAMHGYLSQHNSLCPAAAQLLQVLMLIA